MRPLIRFCVFLFVNPSHRSLLIIHLTVLRYILIANQFSFNKYALTAIFLLRRFVRIVFITYTYVWYFFCNYHSPVREIRLCRGRRLLHSEGHCLWSWRETSTSRAPLLRISSKFRIPRGVHLSLVPLPCSCCRNVSNAYFLLHQIESCLTSPYGTPLSSFVKMSHFMDMSKLEANRQEVSD